MCRAGYRVRARGGRGGAGDQQGTMGSAAAPAGRGPVGVGDRAVDRAGSQDGACGLGQGSVDAVSTHAGGGDAAVGPRGVARRAGATGALLGADPVPGAARRARLRGRLRHGAQRRAAAARRGGGGLADATALRNRTGRAGAGRLGPGAGALRERAGGHPRLRDDAGLLAPGVGGRLRARAHRLAAGRARARLRALRRPHRGDPVRPDAHGGDRQRRGQAALERHLRGLRAALGLRAAAVPAVPGADQGQGRVRGEVREAQLPARPGVPRSRRLQRPARRLAGRDRRCARPRHHPRAADRSLRRARPAPWCRHAGPAELLPGAAPRAGWWPRTGWWRSTPTATRCRGG